MHPIESFQMIKYLELIERLETLRHYYTLNISNISPEEYVSQIEKEIAAFRKMNSSS